MTVVWSGAKSCDRELTSWSFVRCPLCGRPNKRALAKHWVCGFCRRLWRLPAVTSRSVPKA
jgi:hypothetical protein